MYDVGVHLYIAEDRSFPQKLPADFGYSWLLRSSTTKKLYIQYIVYWMKQKWFIRNMVAAKFEIAKTETTIVGPIHLTLYITYSGGE